MVIFLIRRLGLDVIDFVHALCVNSTPVALSTREIERLLGADPEFDGLRQATGRNVQCAVICMSK